MAFCGVGFAKRGRRSFQRTLTIRAPCRPEGLDLRVMSFRGDCAGAALAFLGTSFVQDGEAMAGLRRDGTGRRVGDGLEAKEWACVELRVAQPDGMICDSERRVAIRADFAY